jgi:phosphopantothenoylcysteine decarboxylase/phosphopantothenate--cysteine ligase
LKEYLTSEWTGFNRFNKEPWDNLRNNVDQNGKLVDLGSSIGITALEIGNAIDFEGEIILVDYYNPYREISSLRVIDYAENTSRLIPFKETLERMEVLRGNKIVHYLFGVDVGVSFSEKVLENISNASLVHVGNVLPYVPSKKLFQTLKNALMITSKNGGVLRVHNDNNLPTGALLQSLTVLRENKKLLLIITGGIAAYKIPELITLVRSQGIDVMPLMTKSATKIISPKTVEQASGKTFPLELFPSDFNLETVLASRKVSHIDIADQADLVVVVPATANIIAKLAHGVADDLVTTTLLAVTCPVLISPSMNVNMWLNPVVQSNLTLLKKYGYSILEPTSGDLACGYSGKGRLPDIEIIATEISNSLDKTSLLKDKNIVVTSGGTQEDVDGVRIVSNHSTGKMGTALAEAIFLSGASVKLLRAESSANPRYSFDTQTFRTVADLETLLLNNIAEADICFHVAAISDFSIETKQGKMSSKVPHRLVLTPREKLYKKIKKQKPTIFLVTFKAEWNKSVDELIQIGWSTLKKENMDAIVLNDVAKQGQGFKSEMNEVVVVDRKKGVKVLKLQLKQTLAKEIIAYLFNKKTR